MPQVWTENGGGNTLFLVELNMSRKKTNKLNVAYEYGSKCFREGTLDNPYKHGTYMHKEWQRGFNDAFTSNIRGAAYAFEARA